jgi:hypothetical protein
MKQPALSAARLNQTILDLIEETALFNAKQESKDQVKKLSARFAPKKRINMLKEKTR